MIDIHSHILPGIDDGSQNMSDSLEMAMMSANSGVELLVATPHSNQYGRFENYFDQSFIEHFLRFQQLVKEEHIGSIRNGSFVPLQVRLGMEIYASDDLVQKLSAEKLIGLNGSRFCLIEWAFDESPEAIEDYLSMIFAAGNVPVIAHPERYFCVQEDPEFAYDWLKMGCCIQINKGSVFGRFGRHAKATAEILLENDLVTCAASDAHSPRMRTTYMADIREYLTEEYGKDTADRLLYRNPSLLLKDQMPPKHGHRPVPERHYY